MKAQRVGLVVVLTLVGLFGFGRSAWADEEHPPADHPAEQHEAAAAEHHEGAAEGEHHEGAAEHHEGAEGEHHEGAEGEHHETAGHPDADHDGIDDATEAAVMGDDEDGADEELDKTSMFDTDGDGTEDEGVKKEYEEAFAGIKAEIDTDAVDKELDARPDDAEMKPSMTVEQFRKIVQVVKKVVLTKMEKKMAKSAAAKMRKFSIGVFFFSLCGIFLLGIPLVMGKKYPGKSGVLFKYSALAAVTFFITVNLFGGVLMGMRTVQGALGEKTNPSLAIAAGTFDTLDRDAENFATMGKELFAPTLEELRSSAEQPAVVILENGQKVIKDAKVFVSIAKMFKKIDFLFKILPIILFGVTMLLFGLAIKPTLTEIVKLPMRAAAGEQGVGRDVSRKAIGRIVGELKAAIATIVVLFILTLLSAFVLGQIVGPALSALLDYFSRAVAYLMFQEGASSGLVFLTLFTVVLFLVFNLATLILSMAFYLGKTQKIFQQRFNEGVPLSTHKRFFQWGTASVLLVQLLPWLFAFVAGIVLHKIDASLTSGINDADAIPWTKLMLAGPLFLVVGFLIFFWAARGLKAIKFLLAYKVTPPVPPVPMSPAEPV